MYAVSFMSRLLLHAISCSSFSAASGPPWRVSRVKSQSPQRAFASFGTRPLSETQHTFSQVLHLTTHENLQSSSNMLSNSPLLKGANASSTSLSHNVMPPTMFGMWDVGVSKVSASSVGTHTRVFINSS